eukprot:12011763-Alexandrium_andersonii.AAC.1
MGNIRHVGPEVEDSLVGERVARRVQEEQDYDALTSPDKGIDLGSAEAPDESVFESPVTMGLGDQGELADRKAPRAEGTGES